jgi:signal recognition particle subunit SRP68
LNTVPTHFASAAPLLPPFQDADGAATSARDRNHFMRRLAKAAKWAAQLETLCAATGDERTALEASAYASWMGGNVLLEKEEWASALERLATAHRICSQLGEVGDLADQDRFSARAAEIEPR